MKHYRKHAQPKTKRAVRRGAARRRVQHDAQYSEALVSLRAEAEVMVEEGFRAARQHFLDLRPDMAPSRLQPGQECRALFEGAINAIVNQISRSARPGQEIEMARVVAATLISRVETRTCAGSA